MQEVGAATVGGLIFFGIFGYVGYLQFAIARNKELAIGRRWKALALALVAATILVLFCAVIISNWMQNSAPAFVGAGLMLVLMLTAGVLNLIGRVTEKYQDELEPGTGARAIIGVSKRRIWEGLVARWRQWRAGWIPNGFSAFRIRRIGSPLNLLEFVWSARFYFASYLVVGASLVTLYVLRNPGSENSNDVALRIWGIFYVNMFAVTLTPLFVLSWLTIKYLSVRRVIRNQVALRQSVGILASWSGGGAAITLVLGLLSYIPSRFLPPSATMGPPQPFSNSAIADYILIGGSVGFLAALYQVLASTTRSMEDRLLAVALPAAVMTGWTWIFAYCLGFTPRENASYTLGLIKSSVKLPSDPARVLAQALTDWKTMLAVGGDSGLSIFPGRLGFVLMIASVTAVWSLTVQLRKQDKEKASPVEDRIELHAASGGQG